MLVVAIGRLFLTSYLLPFEVASVLLLAALIGAVMLVRGRPEDREEEETPPEAVTYDEDQVNMGTAAFGDGVKAFQKKLTEDKNPHTENPDYSSWLAGYREAARAAD